MSLSELKAMISLLDDEQAIVRQVLQDLIANGHSMYDELEDICMSGNENEEITARIEYVLQRIKLKQIKPKIAELLPNCETKLPEILHLTAQLFYPRADFETLKVAIHAIRKSVERETNPTYSLTHNIAECSRVLYDTYKFRLPDRDNQNLPVNYIIDDVLSTSCGNELIFCLLYYHIAAQFLKLPIETVLIQQIPFLAAKNITRKTSRQLSSEIACYINPADGGKIYTRKEIEQLLKENDIPFETQMLLPCPPIKVIHAYWLKMNNILSRNEQYDLAQSLKELAALIDIEN